MALPHTRIDLSEQINPAPSWPFPPSLLNRIGGDPQLVTLPFCRVTGTIETEIHFELWLPLDWNGKFLGVGSAGLTGSINYPLLRASLLKHYATATTDMGHVNPTLTFDVSWIDGHPQRVEDFGHRAQHLTAEISKKIVAAYYGHPARHAYFNGCSAGGWQALTEAQKYPQDYDGIIGGAPTIEFVRYQTRPFWVAHLSHDNPSGDLPPEKVKLITDAAVEQCDPEDGVTDGIVSNPDKCGFNPAQLQCAAGDDNTCLTKAQVARAQTIWGRYRTAKGLILFPGPVYGAPSGFKLPQAEIDAAKIPAILRMLPDRNWTPETFDPDRDIPPIEQEFGASMDADDPDLRPFAARHGKLILYQGWNDPGVSPYSTIDYYRNVQRTVGDAKTAAFSTLYLVPGMGHCRGGAGPDHFDMVAALENWVEKAQKPARVIAFRRTKDGTVDMTRPICPYPQIAKYLGTGDTNDAASFVCAPQDR